MKRLLRSQYTTLFRILKGERTNARAAYKFNGKSVMMKFATTWWNFNKGKIDNLFDLG